MCAQKPVLRVDKKRARLPVAPEITLVSASPPCYPRHMSKKPRIAEAEWPIMEFLWERESATAAQIIEHVSRLRSVSDRTIKAQIHRLVQKGLADFTVDAHDSRVYHYKALVNRDEEIRKKSRGICSMVYGEKISDMLIHFVDDADLKAGEIEDLLFRLVEKKAALRKKDD